MSLEPVNDCSVMNRLSAALSHEIHALFEELVRAQRNNGSQNVSLCELTWDEAFLVQALLVIEIRYAVKLSLPGPCEEKRSLADLCTYCSEQLAMQLTQQADAENGLLAEVGTETSNVSSTLVMDQVEQEIPLTDPQLEILLAAQVGDGANCCFNECVSLRMSGMLNVEALTASWKATINNRDALRMTLNDTGDRMRWVRDLQIAILTRDLTGLDDSQYREERSALLVREGRIPFNLMMGPLIRATLLTKRIDEHELIITAHHMICDGWSFNIILEELGERYSAIVDNRLTILQPARSYRSFALSLADAISQQSRAESANYWENEFLSIPETLEMPTDRPRPAQRSFAGATFTSDVSPELTASVRQAGAKLGCTLFTTLLGTWQVLLSRLTDNPDIVTLIPYAGNASIEGATLVGHCVYLLPIRGHVVGQQSVGRYLRQLQGTVLGAHEHHEFTYGSLVQVLKISAASGRLPLSEVQFNLEKLGASVKFSQLDTEVLANNKLFVNFDLFLNVVESSRGLRLECDYNTDLFDERTIKRYLEYYRNLLTSIVEDPSVVTGKLTMLGAEEHKWLTKTINRTYKPYPRDSTLWSSIDRQLRIFPDSTAVEFGDDRLSRRDIQLQTSCLAALLQEKQIGPGHLVAIYMDRSIEMLLGLLAVLKCGAAYVPLDPLYPRERISAILQDTNISMVLTLERNFPDLPSGCSIICLDRTHWRSKDPGKFRPIPINADSLAYVIYTSGSTGKPKGVEITHRSVLNLLHAVETEVGIKSGDRLLAITTVTFDIAVLELLLPLMSGATLVIGEQDDAVDGVRLLEVLRMKSINVMQATPVTWRMLLSAGFVSSYGFKMLCGGEAWGREMANRLLLGGGRLWNMYGPTETTIWSSVNEVPRDSSSITIGPPLANTQFYVLDGNMQPVPVGSSGELFVGGDGVARGYHHQIELTNTKFLPDPFRHEMGGRIYRTGDLVRLQDDGRLQYLRRADQQIKLRGFRIEIGEIEHAIMALETIEQAAVLLKTDLSGDQRLVAYLTARVGDELESNQLRAALRLRLPEYMIPSHFHLLPEFPLTPNRKIDRKRLPEPNWPTMLRSDSYVAPSTPKQKQMAVIWADVLGIRNIGVNDSLIELGADSLKMFQISARAIRCQLPVTVKQLMQLRTIACICDDIEKSLTSMSTASDLVVTRAPREPYRIGTH
jgi:amino acid adenylation domain-containing protein